MKNLFHVTIYTLKAVDDHIHFNKVSEMYLQLISVSKKQKNMFKTVKTVSDIFSTLGSVSCN